MAAALVLVAVTAGFLAIALTMLRIEGDVARALKGTTPAFAAHQTVETLFGAPSKDEVFLVRAEDFGDPASFSALEDLVLGLQLTEGVRAVLSLFILPDPDGSGLSYLTREDVNGLPPADRLDQLRSSSPLAPNLISADRSAVLLTILPDLAIPAEERLAYLRQEIGFADPALRIESVSLAALQREISAGLVADQVFITPIATALCVFIALLLFRSWRAAVLCAVPSLMALAWTFATMALIGLPFDPLMAIVPTLIIVLGIADCVHVFHVVQRYARDTPMDAAMIRGLHETMPAVILAALTTALAFGCLLFVGSPTLTNVAMAGPIALVLTTLAVYVGLPPFAMLLFGKRPLAHAHPMEFGRVIGATLAMMRQYRLVSVTALVLLGGLLVMQTQTVIGYRLMDHIPRKGAFRSTLTELREVLPGSDQSFVIVQAADPEPGLSDADLSVLAEVSAVLYGSGAVLVPSRNGPGADNAIMRRFESGDGAAFAVPVIGELDRTWEDILAARDNLRAELDAAGLEEAQIAGYSLMSSVELPIVVEELRFSFYVAVALVTVLAAILLNSVRVALLSLVPNLVPILGVEAWLVLSDRPLTIIGAIAFTIAFGIAVDDTIHLLNRVRLARGPSGKIDRNAIEAALRQTAAPILTTSLVLLAGFTVTAFSILPSVSVFGQLTGAAMLLALVTDLFLFPSLLCWGGIGAKTR
ncbi:MAG: MMPL family transporter [Paracoccaceae bacterium]|nr:MMPL family transporter [Paracoccaceae bacterium]